MKAHGRFCVLQIYDCFSILKLSGRIENNYILQNGIINKACMGSDDRLTLESHLCHLLSCFYLSKLLTLSDP